MNAVFSNSFNRLIVDEEYDHYFSDVLVTPFFSRKPQQVLEYISTS